MTIWKSKKGTGAHDRNRRKAYQLRSEQVTTTIENKIKQQFGFIADPKKTLLHHSERLLRPCQHSNLVLLFTTFSLSLPQFHTTKTTRKNFTFTIGSWTQIYPDTTTYKHMQKFRKNHNAQIPTCDPSTLPFCRNNQFFR